MERELIYAADLNTNAGNLLDWLKKNAVPEYFAKVERGDTSIDCYEGDTLFVRFCYDQTKNLMNGVSVTTNNAANVSVSNSSYAGFRLWYAYKTAHGLVLQYGTSHDDTMLYAVGITKDGDGNVAVICTNDFWFGSGHIKALTKNSLSTTVPSSNGTMNSHKRQRTALCPIIIDDDIGRTLPHAFYTPFTQNPDKFCVVDADGKKCISVGNWCLMDE
jgi:hypothetical protein